MITPSLAVTSLLVTLCHLVSFVVAYLFYPETPSMSLEELGNAPADGQNGKG